MKPATLPARACSRRAFLRGVSTGTLVLGLPTLVACGGGAADGPAAKPEPSTPPIGSVDAGERTAALNAVQARFDELAAAPGATRGQVLQGVAAAMLAHALYAEAGFDLETECAWGVFRDGRVHIVALNRDPVPAAQQGSAAAARAHAAAARTELPAANRATVLHSFGPGFEGQGAVADLSTWLTRHGYQVRPTAEGDAGVPLLRTISGEGFFYINTHGGWSGHTLYNQSGLAMYSIQSSTLVTDATEGDALMRDDIDNRRLTYFTAQNGEVDWLGRRVSDTRYGITQHFVEKYWQFAADSVLIINACSSAREGARWGGGFVFALHKAQAGVVMAWTRSCSGGAQGKAYSAPRFFVDRMLGANAFMPEATPQRAFGWDSVLANMHRNGLYRDLDTGAEFVARPNPTLAQVQALAPSIHKLRVDELRNEVALHGLFGSRQGDVTIEAADGSVTPLAVKSWSHDKIVCDLPLSGPASFGAVQVKLDQMHSNVRHITQWQLAIDFLYALPPAPGLRVAGTAQVRLRSDVGRQRDDCGAAPIDPIAYAHATRDSVLPLTASGSFSGQGCGVTWSGSATYPGIKLAGDEHELIAYLRVDTATRAGALGLAVGSNGQDFVQNACGVTNYFAPGFGTMTAPAFFANPIEGGPDLIVNALAIAFDQSLAIPGGINTDPLLSLTWSAAAAQSVPLTGDAF